MRSALDPRRAVVALGLLGVVIFAGGAWTLNRTGAASPALASLAAALHAPASAPHAKPDPGLRGVASEPALSVASSPQSSTAAAPFRVDAGESTFEEQAARATIAVAKAPHRARGTGLASPQSGPAEPAPRLQIQNVAARTKTAPPHVTGGCGGLGAFSRVLCTLRECRSPPAGAQARCAHARQVELARQQRMERE
jgi:hypothetical protein